MRISLNWLKEFVNLELSPSQIAEMLTNSGIEVDAIDEVGGGFCGVVVGEVLKIEKHPDADKLCVAQVSDGVDTFQVVCGAPNCRKGLKVAFAKVGAKLKDGKIKKGKLRGVESFGMLCSTEELGLGAGFEGIMELPNDLIVGSNLEKIYSDYIFEVSLTPNLGHCNSILGIARELAALTNQQVALPMINLTEGNQPHITQIEVRESQGCSKYACRRINDVTVKPSPDWMQQKLVKAGLRPINNVVDATNYVLLELGHPLHAFDAAKLEGEKIIIRRAKEGEPFTTLDGKQRLLNQGDLLICDEKKVIALAGVMGGANTEVSDSTTDILLEAAYFNPVDIQKTSQKLGIQSDSSKRFEKGTDPSIIDFALDRAASLIAEFGSGTVQKGIVSVANGSFERKEIGLRLSRTNKVLGVTLSAGEVEFTLKSLGMDVKWTGDDAFQVKVPTYRPDVDTEIDLIEEVARIYGYQNIRPQNGVCYQLSPLPHAPIYIFEKEIRERLTRKGMQEFLNCDLISPNLSSILQMGEVDHESFIQVLNPVSEEQSILRTSLLPGLLEVVKYNQDHQISDIHGFEVGRVYFKDNGRYIEQNVVGIVLAGKRTPHDWSGSAGAVDFYDIKGTFQSLMEEVGVEEVEVNRSSYSTLHDGRQASFFKGGLEIATLGEVHPAILKQLGINQRVYFAEISLDDLLDIRRSSTKMAPLPKYPGSERDWTITLNEKFPVGKLLETVRSIPSKLLQEVSLNYLYRSDKIGKDKKNATLRFTYRDAEKTLSQESVEKEHQRIINETQTIIKI